MRLFQTFIICLGLTCPTVLVARQISTAQPKPMTNQDVVLLVTAKFDDTTIIKIIQAQGTNFDISPSALTGLKNSGVSQAVIQAMLSAVTDKKAPAKTDSVNPPAAAGAAKASDLPDEARHREAVALSPGAYYWNGEKWITMQSITLAGGGAKHVGKVFVPGLTPQMVWTFRDPEAPVQVSESLPRFCFKLIAMPPGMPYAPSGRDILIVRFDEKKDHRELQTTSGGNMFTFKSGLSNDRTPAIEITELDSSTYLVSPKQPLKNGEYLLTNSSLGATGYDFGFHSEK